MSEVTPNPGPEEDTPTETTSDEAERGGRRRRLPTWAKYVIVAALIGWVVLLASLTYADTSAAVCGTCHESATITAAASLHADVPCLACHEKEGILGAIWYMPTLAREVVDQATGWAIADGVLQPAACTDCHEDLDLDSPLLADGHPGPESDCASCHGAVDHPLAAAGSSAASAAGPHPADYTFLHGRDAVPAAAACAECHAADFCSACHVGNSFPHQEDWTTTHGKSLPDGSVATCTLCHEPTYCAACHGGPIPHPEDWLSRHFFRQEANVAACATCHTAEDCAICHARHEVHVEQRIYEWEPAP